MKRTILLLACLLSGCIGLWAQNKALTPAIHIKGVFKRDFQGCKEGTPFVLHGVMKLKNAPSNGASRTQAVLVANGIQFGLPIEQFGIMDLQPDDKNSFWQCNQLADGLVQYYESKGKQEELRKEQAQEANDYVKELEQSGLFYEDAAVEDYLQCLLMDIVPEQTLVDRGQMPQVRLLKSPSPDVLMLANNCLLVSTGMLTTLDTEDELCAVLAREVAHFVLDHAIITVNKNLARARRAEFWGAVMDGVAAATEEFLYERYDYYAPGLVFATNDMVQALINEKIINRMGLDYSEAQEKRADTAGMAFMELTGKDKGALVSALNKIYAYYEREQDTEALSKYGTYGTLPKRLEKLGQAPETPVDRAYLKKTSSVVSFEAAMLDYNKNYRASRLVAQKNIGNGMACADDYLMVARSIMKQSNAPESNRECLSYLDKADEAAQTPHLNSCKMRILLLLRENKQVEAVDLLHQYRQWLNTLYEQPHSESDAQWIAAEHTWAEKLLNRTYIL